VALNARRPAGAGRPISPLPNGLGFDYFWGFLGGEASQYDTVITENNTVLGPPQDEDFYFPDAMADKTIQGFAGRSLRIQQAVFHLFSRREPVTRRTTCRANGPTNTRGSSMPAGTHYACKRSKRQRKLGVIPADAQLTPRTRQCPPGTRSPRQRRRSMRAKWKSSAATKRTRITNRASRLGHRGDRYPRRHVGYLYLRRQRLEYGRHDDGFLQ